MGSWGTGVFDDDHAREALADLREASVPGTWVEQFFLSFLAETADGLAQDWSRVREVLAVCAALRAARAPKHDGTPEILLRWLKTSGFTPSGQNLQLAGQCLDRVLASTWHSRDWPEFWLGSVLPLARHWEDHSAPDEEDREQQQR